MAVDLKYSLPGIVTDEPDVYETNYIDKEITQTEIEEEAANDNIDIYSIDNTKAYELFKDKGISSRFSDFSDSIGPGKRKYPKGYITLEYDPEAIHDETPLDKYIRIKKEISDLHQELNQLGEARDPAPQLETGEEGVYRTPQTDLRPELLVKDVQSLDEQMEQLSMKYLQAPSSVGTGRNNSNNIYNHVTGQNFRELLKSTLNDKGFFQNLKSFPTTPTTTDTTRSTETKPSETAPLTFDLYCDAGTSDYKVATGGDTTSKDKIAELLQRLGKLETVVGNRKPLADKSLTLSSNVPSNNSILEALSVLQYKVSTLTSLDSPENLDAIDLICKNLRIKYAELFSTGDEAKNLPGEVGVETRGTLDHLTKEEKLQIHQLYELTKTWDPLCTALPEILDQLSMLDDTFRKGNEFTSSYAQLQENQGRIQRTLEQNREALEQAKQDFRANMVTIEKNCRNLEDRLSKL